MHLQESGEMYLESIYVLSQKGGNVREQLVRLFDDELGFISPEEFIPIAEQNGLIISIGEAVFDYVCEFLKDKTPEKLGIEYIEVNLSIMQCMERDLPERLLKIIKNHGVDTRLINFEITETAAISNPEIMLNNMSELIKAGAAFSLDDYGSGFANINYLYSLPINIVKIDKKFIWNAMKNESTMTILRHAFQMIHEMGLYSVAEGVETEEMANKLKELGCDYFQGFLYSRPIPTDEFMNFIKSNS